MFPTKYKHDSFTLLCYLYKSSNQSSSVFQPNICCRFRSSLEAMMATFGVVIDNKTKSPPLKRCMSEHGKATHYLNHRKM